MAAAAFGSGSSSLTLDDLWVRALQGVRSATAQPSSGSSREGALRMTSMNSSRIRAWLISACGISEESPATSSTRPMRLIWAGFYGAGVQNVVWSTQQLSTVSAKLEAWTISMVRVLRPSAWPFSIWPGLRSTIKAPISGNRGR